MISAINSGLPTPRYALGLDAKTIGELAGINKSKKGSKPPKVSMQLPMQAPMQSSEKISELVDYLANFFEITLITSDETALSDEEKQFIYTQVT
jgi:hypothetical protein